MNCPHCGHPNVIDDTYDFGNGLVMRSTCRGVEFRIYADDASTLRPGAVWTSGISRDAMLAFLRVKDS